MKRHKIKVTCRECSRPFTLVWVGKGKPTKKDIADAQNYTCGMRKQFVSIRRKRGSGVS